MAICWSLQDSCGTLTWLHMIILVLQDSWMHGRTFYKTNMILWSLIRVQGEYCNNYQQMAIVLFIISFFKCYVLDPWLSSKGWLSVNVLFGCMLKMVNNLSVIFVRFYGFKWHVFEFYQHRATNKKSVHALGQ